MYALLDRGCCLTVCDRQVRSGKTVDNKADDKADDKAADGAPVPVEPPAV